MRPTVDELHDSGRYRLIESFRIDDMNQFILRELGTKPPAQQPGKRTWRDWLMLLAIAVVGGVLGFFTATGLLKGVGKPSLVLLLGQFGAALLGLFVLLPLHEFIHGLAFKRVGAPKVGYGYSVKSLIVYAYSQNFPTTLREVAFVAVMPFLVITSALLIGWLLLPAYKVFWVLLLLIHTSACIGDFALIRYWYKNRPRTIYTYDDVEDQRMTYFFERV